MNAYATPANAPVGTSVVQRSTGDTGTVVAYSNDGQTITVRFDDMGQSTSKVAGQSWVLASEQGIFDPAHPGFTQSDRVIDAGSNRERLATSTRIATNGAVYLAAMNVEGASDDIQFTIEVDGTDTLTTYTGPTGVDVAMTVEPNGNGYSMYRVTLADRNDTDAPPIAELETVTASEAGAALGVWALAAHNPEQGIPALDARADVADWRTNPRELGRALYWLGETLATVVTGPTFTCECGEAEYPVAPGGDESTWCDCGARLDEQRANL